MLDVRTTFQPGKVFRYFNCVTLSAYGYRAIKGQNSPTDLLELSLVSFATRKQSQIANILGFVDHTVYVTTQLWHDIMWRAIDNM